MKKKLRRTLMGLQTVLGMKQNGFFIPCRYAGGIKQPGPGYPAIAALFEAARGRMAATLALLDEYREELLATGSNPPPAPRWNQDWFPRTDAAVAYAMVRTCEPARIVEIGSGHSTRFFRQAVLDGKLNTAIAAIDPAPRADLTALGDIDLVQTTVQETDPAIFNALQPGDILSIDSSHILMPGTDVDLLLNTVLPGLPAGVHIHIHDIFLPGPYPAAWSWRGYNEQQAIATLIATCVYRIDWAAQYALGSGLLDGPGGDIVRALPLPDGALESSLWVMKE